ncbi:energy-coupled thiamine transporter ThiT [Candidatus Soleaferrea massiliensis]|uniref:energy-coupled thiamine transporter ThiT n=1 Tax=Candidatus Soleaferrea massiliensis TaxID=1470354 RepID=UPI00059173A2|nr:energy-coupled thiamine transporter ThiT [Candidatus Soleaferrea massiliensis]
MNPTVKKLTHGALMVALATVLYTLAVFKLPNGGAITVGSMVPLMVYAFMYNVKWSLLVSLVFAGIQLVIGFYPPPSQDFLSFFLLILLEYIIVFGVPGLAGVFGKLFKGKASAMVGATVIVMVIQFICHFIAGILIWNSFAPEGQPVWLYSLLYNGSYMIGELIISSIFMLFIAKYLNLKKLRG